MTNSYQIIFLVAGSIGLTSFITTFFTIKPQSAPTT
jgi:hypothetical protein